MNSVGASGWWWRVRTFWIALVTLGAPLLHAQNTPPGILPIADQTTEEDVSIVDVPLVIGDAETPAGELGVTAASENPVLFQSDGLLIRRRGANWSLTLTPALNRSGDARVTVRVTDSAGDYRQTAFNVHVTPVNDPPAISPIGDQLATDGALPLLVPFSVRSAESKTNLAVSARMLRTNLVNPTLTVFLFPGSTNATHRLAIQPHPGQSGSGVVQVQATDGIGTNTTTFVLTIQPGPFSAGASNSISGVRKPISLADLDGDGDLDLLALGTSFDLTPTIFRNDGAGKWTRGPSLGFKASSVAWCDYDGDGDLDALLLNTSIGTGEARLYRNDSTRDSLQFTLVPVPALGEFQPLLAAAWGDFDRDGRPDLIVSGGPEGARVTQVLWNRGDHFEPDSNALSLAVQAFTVGDLDNDGWIDVIAIASFRALVLHNVGGGMFELIRGPWQDVGARAAGIADFNGDGWPDVWLRVPFNDSSGWLVTYLAMGRDLWTKDAVIPEPGGVTATLLVGDFDQDGSVDVIERALGEFPSPAGIVTKPYSTLFHNLGDGTFEPGGHVFSTMPQQTLTAADLNGDGSLDVIVYEFGAKPQLNVGTPLNSLPSAPTDLVSKVSGTHASLSWGRSHDLNQRAALTYNVRIGSQPGANDLMPSMSSATGVRLLPAPGNTGFCTELTVDLRNSKVDTVYWSVQAVDASLAGGPWAEEKSLFIDLPDNQAPTITGPAELALDEDGEATARFTITDDHSGPARLKVAASTSPNTALLDATPGPVVADPANPAVATVEIALRGRPDQFGGTTLAVVASDGAGRTSTNFVQVTVRPVNDPPILMIPEIPARFADWGVLPVVVRVADAETPPGLLQLAIVGTSDGLDPGDVEIESQDNIRTITFRRVPPGAGVLTVDLELSDADGARVRGTISINRVAQLYLSRTPEPDGRLRLLLGLEAGHQYVLERSPNLGEWFEDSTLESATSMVRVALVNPPPEWQRVFYRLRRLD